MLKAPSYCAFIFHHAARLCRRASMFIGAQNPIAKAVCTTIETLESRCLLSSVSTQSVTLTNGLLSIVGSSTNACDLTVNLVNNGSSIDASADDGHARTVSLASVTAISITGGAGSDYIYVDSNITLPVTINGGGGNDQVRGGGGVNTIIEGNGNDWVEGRGSADSITAGNGNDVLLGGPGNDTITAGSGSDSLDGAAGNDVLTAGNGNDTLTGDVGNDTLAAGSGTDTLNGGLGNDSIICGNGPTTAIPGSGTNTVVVGGPNVVVIPSAGRNTIVNANGQTAIPVVTVSSVSTAGWTTYSAPAATGTNPHAVMQVLAPAATVGIAIDVQALNSTLGTGTPIDANYQWSFGDPTSQYNYLPGFNASHIYTAPGTYTITLTVTNNLGQFSTISNPITISADARRLIYVDSVNGNDGSNGSTPGGAVKTAARADALVNNNTEVLFDRGEVFNLSAAFKLDFHNVLVGAYGTGANPLINYTAPAVGAVVFTTNSSAAAGVTVEDVTITTLMGTDPTNTHMPMGVMAGGFDMSVIDCTFDYVEYDINASAAPVGLTVIGNSSPIEGGLQGYFLWDQATDTTALGNYVNGSVHEHVIRTSGATQLLIDNNNFNNFDGKGCIEVHEGADAWVEGNIVNSGDIRVGPLGLWGEPVTDGTNDCVVQGNYVNNSDIVVYPGAHDISIRDNVINRAGSNMIDVRGEDGLGRQSSDIRILNNTGIDTSSASGQFLVIENHVDGVILENNLLEQPNLATGGNLTAPVYVTEANLSSFSYINGNVWQEPKTIYNYARGGINFVATSYSINGYLTPAAWNAESVVGTDYFSNTPISGDTPTGGIALSVDTAIPGVFNDINGKQLQLSGKWTAGAVDV